MLTCPFSYPFSFLWESDPRLTDFEPKNHCMICICMYVCINGGLCASLTPIFRNTEREKHICKLQWWSKASSPRQHVRIQRWAMIVLFSCTAGSLSLMLLIWEFMQLRRVNNSTYAYIYTCTYKYEPSMIDLQNWHRGNDSLADMLHPENHRRKLPRPSESKSRSMVHSACTQRTVTKRQTYAVRQKRSPTVDFHAKIFNYRGSVIFIYHVSINIHK